MSDNLDSLDKPPKKTSEDQKDKPLTPEELAEYLSHSETKSEPEDKVIIEKNLIENKPFLEEDEDLKSEEHASDDLNNSELYSEPAEQTTKTNSVNQEVFPDLFPISKSSPEEPSSLNSSFPSSSDFPPKSTVKILDEYNQHWSEVPSPDKLPDRYRVWFHWSKKTRDEIKPNDYE